MEYNQTIARLRGTYIKYYEKYLEEQYLEFNITLDNNKELKEFEKKVKEIYLLENDQFIQYLENIHPADKLFAGLYNINTNGLLSIIFLCLHRIEKTFNFNNSFFYIKGKKYILTTIYNTKGSICSLSVITNPTIDIELFNNSYIITEHIDGNLYDLIIELPEYKDFDFDNNNYEKGEKGFFLNPKKINFVSTDTLIKKGIII